MKLRPKDKLKVYVVDDSDIDTFLIKSTLTDLPFTCDITYFKDAETAGKKILSEPQGQQPDLILLDLNLPITDGYTLLDELDEFWEDKETYPSLIFVLTSSIQLRDREKFKNQRIAQEFITKPLIKDDFLNRLEQYFELSTIK